MLFAPIVPVFAISRTFEHLFFQFRWLLVILQIPVVFHQVRMNSYSHLHPFLRLHQLNLRGVSRY